MHEIYSRYGLKPFERASTVRDETILFYFLHRRISRKPSAYKSPEAMLTLLQKFANVPRATRNRHSWILLSIAGRWECLDAQFGCENPTCPEKAELLKLREKRQRGVRDPIIEERLYKWGGASKACAKYVDTSSSMMSFMCKPRTILVAGQCRIARLRASVGIGRTTSWNARRPRPNNAPRWKLRYEKRGRRQRVSNVSKVEEG